MTDQRFQVDTSDYLGFKYEQYKNDLYAMALSKPSDYFALRKKVIEAVKTQAVGDIYKSFFNILSKGLDKEGQTNLIRNMEPCYPQQEVSKIALKASKTLNSILDEVIEIILPQNFKDLANQRLVQKSEQNI